MRENTRQLLRATTTPLASIFGSLFLTTNGTLKTLRRETSLWGLPNPSSGPEAEPGSFEMYQAKLKIL
jgi:hypothetical protein